MWREWDLCLDSYFCMRMSNHSSNTCKDCNTVLILHPCQRSVDCIHRGLFLNCYVPFISLSVFCHYHTILIMVALYYILKSESISPPTLFFFNTVLVILFFFFFLSFHIFKISLSISTKYLAGMLHCVYTSSWEELTYWQHSHGKYILICLIVLWYLSSEFVVVLM